MNNHRLYKESSFEEIYILNRNLVSILLPGSFKPDIGLCVSFDKREFPGSRLKYSCDLLLGMILNISTCAEQGPRQIQGPDCWI